MVGEQQSILKEALASAVSRRPAHKALVACCAAGVAFAATAAPPPAPSSGQILKQSAPPASLPSAPKPVLRLPKPSQQSGQSSVRIPIKKIVISGNQHVPTTALHARVQSLIGHTVTLARLRRATRALSHVYQQRGYPLAYAYLPEQRIHNGVVKIAVVEPVYDSVKISGDSRLKSGQARRSLDVQAQQPVAQAPLERGLLLLRQTPGVSAEATLKPGASTGTTALDVGVRDTPLLHATLGGDNYGAEYTGRLRARLNARLDNPLGYGSRLTVNGLQSEAGLLHSAGGSLLSPNLWRGLRLNAYGSHTDYELGGRFAALDQHGRADRMGVDLRYPLILQPGQLLRMSLGYVRENFEQDIRSVGVDKRSHIDSGQFSLDGAFAGPAGSTESAGLSVRAGNLGFDSAAAAQLDAAGPDAGGGFWAGEFRLGHTQPLPGRLVARATLRGQWASQNLDASQKLYLGGPYGVMSYPVGDAGGDEGLLLRTRLARAFELPGTFGTVTPALLAQAGTVRINHNRYPGFEGPNRVERYGVGAGLRYRWYQHVSGRVAYVHQVGGDAQPSGQDDEGELLGTLRIRF